METNGVPICQKTAVFVIARGCAAARGNLIVRRFKKNAIYAKGGTVEVTDATVTVTGNGTMTEAGGVITHK